MKVAATRGKSQCIEVVCLELLILPATTAATDASCLRTIAIILSPAWQSATAGSMETSCVPNVLHKLLYSFGHSFIQSFCQGMIHTVSK